MAAVSMCCSVLHPAQVGNTIVDAAFEGINALIVPGAGVPAGTPVSFAIGNELFTADAVATTPEPSTFWLLGLGLVGFVARNRRASS